MNFPFVKINGRQEDFTFILLQQDIRLPTVQIKAKYY